MAKLSGVVKTPKKDGTFSVEVEGKKCLAIINKEGLPIDNGLYRLYSVVEKKDKRGLPLFILYPAKKEDLEIKATIKNGEVIEAYYQMAFCDCCGETSCCTDRINDFAPNELAKASLLKKIEKIEIPKDETYARWEWCENENGRVSFDYTYTQGVYHPDVTITEIRSVQFKTGEKVLSSDSFTTSSGRENTYAVVADKYETEKKYNELTPEEKVKADKILEGWRQMKLEKVSYMTKDINGIGYITWRK